MNNAVYDEFLKSDDTLRVYTGNTLLFSSTRSRLLALLEYIDRSAPNQQQVTILDKIMGNAAALLSIKADCQEVCSPLGSRLAVGTLEKHGIKYRLSRIVPYINQAHTEEMCPMEKLSIGKDPEEFYLALKTILNRQ